MADLEGTIDALEEIIDDLRGGVPLSSQPSWQDKTQFGREDGHGVSGGGGLPRAASSEVSSVTSSLSSVTLLAAVANRLNATITNDSNSRLFVKLGAVASVTDYTVRLGPHDTYELPPGYTGIVDGIWSPVVSGSARVTELTP